jgi:hypothetical protein
MRSHTEVAEIRREAEKDERNRYPIAVTVDDCRFVVSIGLPIAALKIDSKCVRRDLTENLFGRELTSDKNHDLKSEREIQ